MRRRRLINRRCVDWCCLLCFGTGEQDWSVHSTYCLSIPVIVIIINYYYILIKPTCKKLQHISVHLVCTGLLPCSLAAIKIPVNQNTAYSNGYLGSRNDEERSEMRYVMRIAEFSESSNS